MSFVLATLPGLLSIFLPAADAQSLFDVGLGTLPQEQGWTYLAIGLASTYLTNNAALLDTTPATSALAGWSEIAPTTLNRTNGFTLHFSARIDAETHSSTNRAGFSVIVLTDDAHGLELGFWSSTIFAQADKPLFTHGEEVTLSTTNTFLDYSLSFFATNYVLKANGRVILTGPVRNYTAYNGPFNVYSTPNFLFLGDDTTSAAARAEIRNVSFIGAPALFINPADIVTWTGISNQVYEVQVTSDLMTWTNAAAIASANSTFSYTNSTGRSPQFYRVIVP